MKPMLAEDWVEEKVVFPVGVQPKIDGVRGINLTGTFTGRSLKQHANRYTTKFFSHSALARLDGEVAAESEVHPDLCRITASALNTIEGEPYTLWHLFDTIIPGVPFQERHASLRPLVEQLNNDPATHHIAQRLRVVPLRIAHSMEELNAMDDEHLDLGYEGTIFRKLNGVYKFGRSTPREGLLMRIKRFIEEDAVVLAIEEGRVNQNEAKRNELGYIERSTHAENMVPNGMVGNLRCLLVRDVVNRGELLFRAGQEITVGAGCMPHSMRRHYFLNPHEIVSKVIKFKTFPVGVKDKPRFPIFVAIRTDADKVA